MEKFLDITGMLDTEISSLYSLIAPNNTDDIWDYFKITAPNKESNPIKVIEYLRSIYCSLIRISLEFNLKANTEDLVLPINMPAFLAAKEIVDDQKEKEVLKIGTSGLKKKVEKNLRKMMMQKEPELLNAPQQGLKKNHLKI